MALVKGKFVDKNLPIQSNNDPVDPNDLARKSYVDQKAADEAAAAVAALDLSGKADLVDGKVPDEQINTSAFIEDQVMVGVTDKAPSQNATMLAINDRVSKAGDEMTGNLIMGSNKITQLGMPEDGTDAASKAYIDGQIGNLEGNPDVAGLVGSLANAVFGAKGQPNGFAELDENGKVPAAQLPSYVDDVEEYSDLASFPAEGSAGKLYVAQDTNKVYRWSGTVYIEISASPGSTDAVPEGSINKYYTDARAAAAAPVQSVAGKVGAVTLAKGDGGLSNVDNTSDLDKPISTATATALAGKQASLGTGTTSQYLRGDLTWQTISTSAPMAQIKHVAKSGVAATADGSQEKPYLTIAAAMASITDATPSKRYVIKIAAGAYSEAISIKANVFLVGESKESVRITGAVSMNADFNQASSQDCRSGASMVSFLSAADFNWTTVTSPAGKLYFNEVVFGSTLAMYGYNNAIAQAQLDSCILFGNLTISGINVGVFTNNVCYGNITLNQHPNGGMASILNAAGGYCAGTVRLNTTVSDFNRRCSGFLRGMNCENLIIDGASSYADVDLVSQGKASTQKLNGGNLVALNPRISHDLETQMLKPLANNAHNSGDWGKQWFFNFAYVHASAGTEMYLTTTMESYDPAGDTAGRPIYIQPDGYGLKPNVSGGDVILETAAVSGTGVRGKVKIDARHLDMSSKQIKALADGTDAQDAVTKAQLDAAIGAVPAGLSGKKEVFFRNNRSAADIMSQAKNWNGKIKNDADEYTYQLDLLGGESCEVFSECGS